MIVSTTALIGPNDLSVMHWTIIELPAIPNKSKGIDESDIDRHIFGWSPETCLWQLSSKIIEETDEYIQTRSRKYFKDGLASAQVPLDGRIQLTDFLHAWRVNSETIEDVLSKIS